MSPAVDDRSGDPFIAGADDPMTTSDFQDHPDDPFDASKYIDFSNSSPDTLQRLDASHKSGATPFSSETQLGFSASHQGEYYEYSDDSAGSSKRSLKRNEQVQNGTVSQDMVMDGDFGSGAMNYDDIFDQDAPFMPESDNGHSIPDGFFDDPSFMSNQQADVDQTMTSKATSTTSGLRSPGMPTISPSDGMAQIHHRQDSVGYVCFEDPKVSLLLTTASALLDRFLGERLADSVAGGITRLQLGPEPPIYTKCRLPHTVTPFANHQLFRIRPYRASR